MRMKQRKVTREDMELLQPRTLKELVVEELHSANCDNYQRGKPVERLDEDSVRELLDRIYEHIEREALAVFHSNEIWALKSWAYSHILRDVVASEETDGLVSELMSPMVDWQNEQEFDPIGYYRNRLHIEGKSDRTKECYMYAASRFVAKVGRKRNYTDEDIIEYLGYARKRFPSDTSYYQECTRLLQFLRRLPGADKRRELPIGMPKMPTEFYQPTLSFKEVETVIWSMIINKIEPNMVARIWVGSVYGGRLHELAKLSSEDIHLNGDNSTVFIRTGKGGQRKPQPIPVECVPLFALPITEVSSWQLHRRLKQVCKMAGVQLPYRGGFHSFRRRVATEVSEVEHSDINASSFMRWASPRQFSMLARYRQKPVEQTDKEILDKHPFIAIWKQAVPHLMYLHPTYATLLNNT